MPSFFATNFSNFAAFKAKSDNFKFRHVWRAWRGESPFFSFATRAPNSPPWRHFATSGHPEGNQKDVIFIRSRLWPKSHQKRQKPLFSCYCVQIWLLCFSNRLNWQKTGMRWGNAYLGLHWTVRTRDYKTVRTWDYR